MNSIPKIVRQRLGTMANGAHPDANLLSAFAEKSLNSKEETKVFRHLTQCADCRQIVVLAQPEIEAVMEVKTLPATASGLRGMRWAFWAVAVLAVGGMLMLNDREKAAPKRIAVVTQPEQMLQRSATSTEKSANEPSVREKSSAEQKTLALSKRRDAAEVSSVGPQIDRGESAPAVSAMQSDLQNSPVTKDRAASAVPANSVSPAAPTPRSAFAPDAKADANRSAANAMVFSKSAGPRWTLTPDGVLQRSLDAGKTWEPVPVADNANFRVVSALGSDVWLGGTAGALYHSKDAGQHWEQVKPAIGGNTLNADITALEFTDAAHGKVSTASGVWTTSDAGQTWREQ
jgi:hypothetical protein